MKSVQKDWRILGYNFDYDEYSKEFGLNRNIVKIIRNRGVCTKEDFKMFLYGKKENMRDPFLLPDMKKLTDVVIKSIINGDKIRVIGDYDVDGVCSGYILTDGLRSLGGNVDFDVPDRIIDGYGISNRLIDKAAEDGVRLIITCDNGIAADEQVKYVKEKGMDIIVTDHHEVPYEIHDGVKKEKLPSTDVVVDLKRDGVDYPFKELCGAGVTYKIIDALKRRIEKEYDESDNIYACSLNLDMNKYIVFAGIATVCDVVPLMDENRIFVKESLANIDKIHNPGLQALIKASGLEYNKKNEKIVLNSYHYGFVIGPCINAAGRLKSAKLAFDLFYNSNGNEAETKAIELVELNNSRKNMTSEFVDKIIERLNEKETKKDVDEENDNVDNNSDDDIAAGDSNEENIMGDDIIVEYLEGCHESLAGIIAGRIKEYMNRPAIIFTDAKDGILKGSGRSVETYDLYEGLSEVKDILVRFGGHKQAAGLSIEKDNLDILRKMLNNNISDEVRKNINIKKTMIDAQLDIRYLTTELIGQLKFIEPCGKDNEKPIFCDVITELSSIRVYGSGKNVISMTVMNKNGGKIRATIFRDMKAFVEEAKENGVEIVEKNEPGRNYTELSVDNKKQFLILYYPEINEYMGQRNVQIIINDFKWKTV